MKKILIVDDDKDFADIIKTILVHDNFLVVIASNGEEGLRMATSEKPDLILLDLIMPVMDGFSFLEHFRALDDISWIPVIVFTSQTSPEDIARIQTLGSQGYLVKSSIDTHVLKDTISKFLPE